MGKEGVQPHKSKGEPRRHVDIGKAPNKEHQKVKNDLGATAVYGARTGVAVVSASNANIRSASSCETGGPGAGVVRAAV